MPPCTFCWGTTSPIIWGLPENTVSHSSPLQLCPSSFSNYINLPSFPHNYLFIPSFSHHPTIIPSFSAIFPSPIILRHLWRSLWGIPSKAWKPPQSAGAAQKSATLRCGEREAQHAHPEAVWTARNWDFYHFYPSSSGNGAQTLGTPKMWSIVSQWPIKMCFFFPVFFLHIDP